MGTEAVGAEAVIGADVARVARPWSGQAFCTGPLDEPFVVSRLVTRDSNRWSGSDEPTVYLSGDPGVAITELGRHWGEREQPTAIWALKVDLAATIDLRDPAANGEFGLPDDPRWILDLEVCRAIAAGIRERGECDGIIVPSAAFVDDPSRWNLVVFVERLRTDVDTAIQAEGTLVEVVPRDR